jgi:hypothetical protein
MQKSLAEIIAERFPAATLGPTGSVRVQDDGDGAYIAHWDAAAIGAEQPDAAQLIADWTPDLVALRAEARVKVSAAAEAARLQFVTPGSAKAMAYQEKAREATAFAADPDPQPENYPLLQSEVEITADTLAGVAAVVAGKYQLFRQIEAVIGGTEAGAQKAIAEAATPEAIEAVIAGLAWPQP